MQIETYQIGRGVDLEKDNLTRVYSAAYRMFGRIRELMCELPAHEFGKDGSIAAIYEALNSVLNTTLRPHLTEWPERYEDWRKNFGKTTKGKKLSPQEMQQMFPERPAIQRDLKDVARRLKADAKKLRSLILKA
ncbi:MAG TPA: hypothetical protein VLK27_07540 [Chthoniobacterales bacterium]|nr:hypothetical protein [Chthoniobacterales bacterium]